MGPSQRQVRDRLRPARDGSQGDKRRDRARQGQADHTGEARFHVAHDEARKNQVPQENTLVSRALSR